MHRQQAVGAVVHQRFDDRRTGPPPRRTLRLSGPWPPGRRRAAADQFYGERSGIVEDPFGYRWFLSAHIEDVSEQEVLRRAAAACAEGP